jgi:uncharacterized membrane protein YhaH (DUF805 family)
MNPFRGELGRKGYLLWSALAWAFIIANGVIIDMTKSTHIGDYWLGYRVVVVVIFLAIMLLASFRRAQNTKYNPWCALLILVPYIDVLVWLALLFIPSKHRKTN